MDEWSFEHTLATRARRADVWAYWSNLDNHARMEPGVERIDLDGPFATGTIGRTVTADYTQEWTLRDVVPGRTFVMTGFTPDGAGSLSFAWTFADERDDGTRMTQRISATGPEVEHHMSVFQQMEVGARAGMERLAQELDRLASIGDFDGADRR